MTEPVRVYKTVTPGRYLFSSDRPAAPYTPPADYVCFCRHCGHQLLPEEAPHWQIAGVPYCSRCVEIIDPQEVVE